jgi:hypothetical protein
LPSFAFPVCISLPSLSLSGREQIARNFNAARQLFEDARRELIIHRQACGFTANNYQLVEERRLFGTQYLQTLRADLVNPGAARSVVVATVSSNVLNLRVIDGRRNLHFLPVPANSQVTSLDTFQLIVDKNVPTDYSVLQWNFSAPYANAGPNQTVPIGRTVILDASGSTKTSGAGFLT